MMYNTYNMGIGMVLAVDPKDVDNALEACERQARLPMSSVKSRPEKKE